MLHDRTWLLIGRKITNEASADELKELEDILRGDPQLHFSIQTIYGLWQQHDQDSPLQLQNAYNDHLQRMTDLGLELPHKRHEEELQTRLRAKQRSYNKIWLALTVASIAAIVWAALTPGKVPPIQEIAANEVSSEVSTKNGSKSNIVLPDGSKVWLNAGSNLTYNKNFNVKGREVILTGEAYFDVKHNAEKPFVIHTRDMDIKVLGTEFNVKSYPDENTTETSLVKGSIEVTLKDKRAEKIILKPNEKLVIADESFIDHPVAIKKKQVIEKPIISLGHLNYFSKDSTILETSWIYNKLLFEDESFADIARKMERWYGVKFKFTHPSIENLRFTGSFQNETINEALDAMQITAGFNYKISDKTVTLTR